MGKKRNKKRKQLHPPEAPPANPRSSLGVGAIVDPLAELVGRAIAVFARYKADMAMVSAKREEIQATLEIAAKRRAVDRELAREHNAHEVRLEDGRQRHEWELARAKAMHERDLLETTVKTELAKVALQRDENMQRVRAELEQRTRVELERLKLVEKSERARLDVAHNAAMRMIDTRNRELAIAEQKLDEKRTEMLAFFHYHKQQGRSRQREQTARSEAMRNLSQAVQQLSRQSDEASRAVVSQAMEMLAALSSDMLQSQSLQMRELGVVESRALGSSDQPRRPPAPVSTARQAVVKWYDSAKGFGFLRSMPDAEDVFVHRSELRGVANLEEGQSVNFELGRNERGPCAKNVRVNQDHEEAQR